MSNSLWNATTRQHPLPPSLQMSMLSTKRSVIRPSESCIPESDTISLNAVVRVARASSSVDALLHVKVPPLLISLTPVPSDDIQGGSSCLLSP
ncbi:unnamed protein product [Hymenolepis diminuta]|uniref:Uncharacterized protein n=1 Tax=Hymenolepis diminuta TaxID=6216 RepID=A0A564XUT0_HYMDI|nr:unnamed protein product [Hymenolepis diminuta]